MFIIIQTILAAIHFVSTRYYFDKLNGLRSLKAEHPTFNEVVNLLKRGKSLALFSLAGAAVTQLDKPIVSAFMSPAVVAPYFLATTLCMGSLSVLASPVSQFFQPKLLNALSDNNGKPDSVVIQFVSALLVVTLFPGVFLWMLRAPIVDLWMGHKSNNVEIVHYVAILLPGIVVGLMGFLPYSLLISVKDFKFQARLSLVMTIVTLVIAAVFAWSGSIDGVCYTYAGYNTASTLFSWLRAMYLPSVKKLGRKSFFLTLNTLIIMSGFCVVLNYIFQ